MDEKACLDGVRTELDGCKTCLDGVDRTGWMRKHAFVEWARI